MGARLRGKMAVVRGASSGVGRRRAYSIARPALGESMNGAGLRAVAGTTFRPIIAYLQ